MDVNNSVKCGFVTICGAPNVGKSTLLNEVLGTKLAITTNKPQTTRNRIVGILQRDDAQIIFVDTPGIHDSKKPLNQFMVETAKTAITDADVVLLISDYFPKGPSTKADNGFGLQHVYPLLKDVQSPIVLAFNKVDLIENKSWLLPMLDAADKSKRYTALHPISALKKHGIDSLIDTIVNLLPVRPRFYPIDALTEMSERFLVSEIIREKVFLNTHQEVPYCSAVEINDFDDQREQGKYGLCRIMASIIVERKSQKGIVIGKRGKMIKTIGTAARKELENILECKVFLDLQVKINENWSENQSMVERYFEQY